MRMDLKYEYGKRTGPNAKILAVVALAVSGVLLALNADEKQDFDGDDEKTEVILQNSTD